MFDQKLPGVKFPIYFPPFIKKQMMTSDSNSYNEHERGGGHVSVEILHGGRDTIEDNRKLLLGNQWGPLSARAVSIVIKNKTPHLMFTVIYCDL